MMGSARCIVVWFLVPFQTVRFEGKAELKIQYSSPQRSITVPSIQLLSSLTIGEEEDVTSRVVGMCHAHSLPRIQNNYYSVSTTK